MKRKLFFGGAESREVSVNNIEVFEDQIQKDLKVLKTYSETLEKALDVEDHIYYLMQICSRNWPIAMQKLSVRFFME